jgi:hypothetical protein
MRRSFVKTAVLANGICILSGGGKQYLPGVQRQNVL